MTDRPIIFSGPMVRALLAGRKTQTRRLATSPLRKCEPGDRLYVRESGAWQTMTEVAPDPGKTRRAVWYAADGDQSGLGFFGGKMRPSIHMPRWASRLTLRVAGVRVEQLHAISDADAIAEGIREFPCTGPHRGPGATYWSAVEPGSPLPLCRLTPTSAYKALWEELHGDESWLANPTVLVLTFTVERRNIDRLAA